jgi:CBS domain-containing protein
VIDTLQAILERKGRDVVAVSPEATVIDAVRAMNDRKTGSVLVTAASGLVGIFTERDVLCRVVDKGLDATTVKVAEVMTTSVVTVEPAMPVRDAMSLISEKRCRHLPVMAGGELLGMVSIGDLTRWVTRDQETQIQHLVNYITDRYPG